MDEIERRKHVVREMIERVWRQGLLDALPTYWSGDCRNHASASEDQVGLDALRRYHEGFAAAFADFDEVAIDVVAQVAEGDLVVTRLVTTARHRTSDRRVSMATIRIDRIEDGKITEHWSVADVAGLQAQLS